MEQHPSEVGKGQSVTDSEPGFLSKEHHDPISILKEVTGYCDVNRLGKRGTGGEQKQENRRLFFWSIE